MKDFFEHLTEEEKQELIEEVNFHFHELRQWERWGAKRAKKDPFDAWGAALSFKGCGECLMEIFKTYRDKAIKNAEQEGKE